MRTLISLGLIALMPLAVLAQNAGKPTRPKTHALSGYVRDASNGEALPGLTVRVEGTPLGATSNTYGFYSIAVPVGAPATVSFSYVGYTPVRLSVNLKADSSALVRLMPEGRQLEEVVITGERIQDAVEQTQMSANRLTISQIRSVPAIFGEVDPLKVLQLLPGIKVGTEATAGFYVRGGGSDQNLILLDEATVYNAAHIGGLFSIFNPDAVKGLQVYKAGFPAKYGGRLSSILDVQLREGNQEDYGFSGGIGLISSRLTFEGPIQKGRSSFIVSGRRTYVDIFTRIINNANKDNKDFNPIPDYYFYDLNLKANYELGKRDRLFLSGYFGRDIFGFRSQNFNFDFGWGNTTATLRWNHLFSERLFANTTLVYSNYKYDINTAFASFSQSLFSSIEDVAAKVDFDWFPTPKHTVKFGLNYTYHIFTPSGLDSENSSTGTTYSFTQRLYGQEIAAYLSDDIDISDKLSLNPGIRLSGFLTDGVWYGGLEPRMAARYQFNDKWATKASIGRMYQYVHLATNSTASLPTDIWYPTTRQVAPQYSDQVAAGVTRILPKWGVTLNLELYYKKMYSQVELRDGANIFANQNLGQEFTFGEGRSYGAEFLAEKREGKTTGWISYTLSWTDRLFPNLNIGQNGTPGQGRVFPFRYDRRHDISVVVTRELTPRLSATLTFVFRTGEAVTVPKDRFAFFDLNGAGSGTVVRPPGSAAIFIPGQAVGTYYDRNSYRMPNYHRADLSVTWKFKPKKPTRSSELNLSLYNLYDYRNPFFFYIEGEENSAGQIVRYQAKVVSLFPLIPSLTWNFKF